MQADLPMEQPAARDPAGPGQARGRGAGAVRNPRGLGVPEDVGYADSGYYQDQGAPLPGAMEQPPEAGYLDQLPPAGPSQPGEPQDVLAGQEADWYDGRARHLASDPLDQYGADGFGGGPDEQSYYSQFSDMRGVEHDGPVMAPDFSDGQGAYGELEPAAQLQAAEPAMVSLADAVQAAHAEGFGFGDAVAMDAPALWLEAVLARKPRMPSDLEARLLQGSTLPVDSLLHDEVRHALRRGFWDALERSRR
jgi:hypothetical protein